MTDRSFVKLVLTFVLSAILLGFAFYALVVYVLWHFIAKHW